MNFKSIQHGAIGGIAGGIVFGAMMGMMGMLPMIGQMAGSPTATAGFFIHLIISAFIGEPVIGAAAGAYVPPDGYWPAIVEMCRRHHILVIADEVMTGFGRLGTPMGVEAVGLDADIIVGGKGLAGGYAPMGGVYATNDVVGPVAKAEMTVMYYTFAGQDMACAIAREVLTIIRREKLTERSASQGAKLRSRLEQEFSDHPNVNDVRGIGLMQGIGLMADAAAHRPFARKAQFTERVVAAMLERGVWAYPSGSGVFDDALLFGPPFTVTDEHIELMVTTARLAIDQCASET